MGRVTVRGTSGQPKAIKSRAIKCRIEREVIITVTAQGEEKRSEFKIGTEEPIDVDELFLRDGGDAADVNDYRPILQTRSARSKNGSRLRLTEFWV
jgi:hypothetical protein